MIIDFLINDDFIKFCIEHKYIQKPEFKKILNKYNEGYIGAVYNKVLNTSTMLNIVKQQFKDKFNITYQVQDFEKIYKNIKTEFQYLAIQLIDNTNNEDQDIIHIKYYINNDDFSKEVQQKLLKNKTIQINNSYYNIKSIKEKTFNFELNNIEKTYACKFNLAIFFLILQDIYKDIVIYDLTGKKVSIENVFNRLYFDLIFSLYNTLY